MKEIDPVYSVILVIILIVATWFISYRFTMNTLEVEYDPDTKLVWVWDCYGNLDHFGGGVTSGGIIQAQP